MYNPIDSRDGKKVGKKILFIEHVKETYKIANTSFPLVSLNWQRGPRYFRKRNIFYFTIFHPRNNFYSLKKKKKKKQLVNYTSISRRIINHVK